MKNQNSIVFFQIHFVQEFQFRKIYEQSLACVSVSRILENPSTLVF